MSLMTVFAILAVLFVAGIIGSSMVMRKGSKASRPEDAVVAQAPEPVDHETEVMLGAADQLCRMAEEQSPKASSPEAPGATGSDESAIMQSISKKVEKLKRLAAEDSM